MSRRSSDYSYRVDENGRLRSLGSAAAAYLGYGSASALIGQPVDVLFAEEGAAENFLDLLRTRDRVEGLRVSLKHKEGQTLQAVLTGEADYGITESFEGNVAPVPTANRALPRPTQLDAIGTLAGGIAHDFNNILGAVRGFCELALLRLNDDKEPDPEGAAEDIQLALHGIDRAADLVEQILSFSRRRRAKKTQVDVASVLEEVGRHLEEALRDSIELELSVQTRGRTVDAERPKIHQMVLNLCSNAYQAMAETGGVLKLTLEDDLLSDGERGGLRLIVSDTGSGMSEAVRKRVFEPFFTTREVGQGVGLGLSVVHGIVQDCGGSIRCESVEGEGTQFVVRLPVRDEPTGSKPKVQGPPKGHERILLVEDSDTLLRAFSAQLRRLGYEVETAIDGAEALAKFRFSATPYDLVITDLKMPHLSGLELAPALRSTQESIPIILMTGFDELLEEDEVIESGIVDDLLIKPIDLKTLGIAIRRVLYPTTELAN